MPAPGLVVTYRVTAAGGSWDAADNGAYTVEMLDNQVSDTADKFVPAGTLGTFQVLLPQAQTQPLSVTLGGDGTFGRLKDRPADLLL